MEFIEQFGDFNTKLEFDSTTITFTIAPFFWEEHDATTLTKEVEEKALEKLEVIKVQWTKMKEDKLHNFYQSYCPKWLDIEGESTYEFFRKNIKPSQIVLNDADLVTLYLHDTRFGDDYIHDYEIELCWDTNEECTEEIEVTK